MRLLPANARVRVTVAVATELLALRIRVAGVAVRITGPKTSTDEPSTTVIVFEQNCCC